MQKGSLQPTLQPFRLPQPTLQPIKILQPFRLPQPTPQTRLSHPKKFDEELVKAAYYNKINEVRDLLAKGADPNSKAKEFPYDGKPALIIAIGRGNLEIATLLLDVLL